MSNNSVLESEEFHCNICNLLFVDPRVLGCGHTFCLQCVKNVVSSSKDKSKVDCPTCKKVHKFADKKQGADGLTKNIYLENLISKLKAQQQAVQSLPFPYNLYGQMATPNAPAPQEEPQHSETSAYPDLLHNTVAPNLPEPVPTPPPSVSLQPQPQPEPSPALIQSNPPVNNIGMAPSAPSAPSAPPVDYGEPAYYNGPLYPSLQPPMPYGQPPVNSQPAYYPPPQTQPTQAPPPLPPKNNTPAPSPAPTPNQPPANQQNQKNSQPGFWGSIVNFLSGEDTSNAKKEVKPQSPQIVAHFAPFLADYNQVYGYFKKWCSSWWFAPSDFDKKFSIGPVAVCYVPFWVFTMSTTSVYNAQMAQSVVDPATGRKYDGYTPVQGNQQGQYTNLLLCGDAQHSLNTLELLTSFDDWDISKATSTQAYMVGTITPYLARVIDQKTAWTRVTNIVIKKEEEACTTRLKKENKTEKIEQFKLMNVTFSNVNAKLVFLPAYLSHFYYEGKEYEFVVNGQTSQIKGPRPYGLGKVGAAVKGGAQFVGNLIKKL